MVDRIASAWTGRPIAEARVEAMLDADQWTVQGPLRTLRPLWKFSWPNGEQAYVAQTSGEVVQYTTSGSRLGAYLGPIPHWLYFTPLRGVSGVEPRRDLASGLGTLPRCSASSSACGCIRRETLSPGRRPTQRPYRGYKRWHVVLGWCSVCHGEHVGLQRDAVDGSVRRSGPGARLAAAAAAAVPALRRRCAGAVARWRRLRPSTRARRWPNCRISPSSRSSWTSFAGAPVYLATLAKGDTRIIPVDGEPAAEFDRQKYCRPRQANAAQAGGVNIPSVLNQYDRYDLDRRRERPLPVILAEAARRGAHALLHRSQDRAGCRQLQLDQLDEPVVTGCTHSIFRGSTTIVRWWTSS